MGRVISGKDGPWGLAVLVMWMLAAWREREGGPIGGRRLCAELKANLGSESELPRAWAALEALDAEGCLEVAGEPADPLVRLSPLGERVLAGEDAKLLAEAEKLGIRGPYPGARLTATLYLAELLLGEGSRPTVH